jgi:hypothetical protein
MTEHVFQNCSIWEKIQTNLEKYLLVFEAAEMYWSGVYGCSSEIRVSRYLSNVSIGKV